MVVEDAAQALDAYYQGHALGSLGQLGVYSFHETKNCVCGEGGALCINDPALIDRAEVLRDKGTDRKKFLRGEIAEYTWIEVGCSGAPSELASAFLYSQLERIDEITSRRREIDGRYRESLASLEEAGLLRLPSIPQDCQSNHHIFYILLKNRATRTALMAHLKASGVSAVFHYVPLHVSPMGRTFGYQQGDLPITEDLSGRLLRLPCYPDLTADEQDFVIDLIHDFLTGRPEVPD
jgi:dTDP-4-amino-4,6-dideoxygalactose transaminase